MKACIYTIFIAIALSCFKGNAQTPFGARSAGIGGYSVGLKELWAAENNLAALAFYRKREFGIHHLKQFNLTELSHSAFLASLPFENAAFGISISRFGFSLYNESKYSLGFGQKLNEDFALGVQLNYHTTQISEGYGSNRAISANIGMLAMLSDDLQIAVLLINPTRAKLSDYDDERYETLMRLGVQYAFSKKVLLASEVEKSMDIKSILKVGLEYLFQDIFYLRAGMSTNPQLTSFGFGYKRKALKVDFATVYHTSLGISPHISLQFLLDQSKDMQ